jgi:lipid-A-disaccharide synthase
MKNRLVLIAGEVSGDIHAARLIAALKKLIPDLEISGIGGDLMIEQGLTPIFHIREMAFLGIGEVLRHLPFIKKVFREMVQHVVETRPAAVILVDYPGFNLRFAAKIHKLGIPVIYYISPQLWAWGRRRIKRIRKYVNKMLVIFPFEQTFYKDYGISAEYVGHPLADRHFDHVRPKSILKGKSILGLLPGSRIQELEKLLPDMIGAAKRLIKQGIVEKAVILPVQTIPESIYQEYIGEAEAIGLSDATAADYFNNLDAAIVSSGTATLETAYFQVPLVIVYRVSALTWYLGKLFVKLKMIGLANIVAGKPIAAELLQNEFTGRRAADELKKLLDPQINAQKREELKIIKEKLGDPGASERAAEKIFALIQQQPD